MGLVLQYQNGFVEAGLDEAGRGCLAGPVVAAAVILPPDFELDGLNDSKKLSESLREELRPQIQDLAIDWAVGIISPLRIDQTNILKASFEAMETAYKKLQIQPETLLVDGNRFRQQSIPYHCMVKGDSRFMNIAAASVLAKTYRDDIMRQLDEEFPMYHWKKNKGYPTLEHREAIRIHGPVIHHRMSFQLLPIPTLFDHE